MRIRVNPTRMMLLRLRRRVELARRGHKLLKDKLDGLVQRFLSVKRGYLNLYTKLEPKLADIFLKSVMASALSHPQALKEESLKRAQVLIEISAINIMGVRIPSYQLKMEGEPSSKSLLATVELSEALSGFTKILPELVELAASSKSLKLIAAQIIETRRRVNALEYILIPELERNLRLILMKLSELERSSKIVLLKVAKEE